MIIFHTLQNPATRLSRSGVYFLIPVICSCHLSTLSSRHGVSRDPEGFACYYWRCAYGVATRFWTAPRLSAEVQARSTMCQTSISPYTRGNLPCSSRQRDPSRSIPVHTGKPKMYSRDACQKQGLSPYTRGNPRCTRGCLPETRSIPVHTGKPNVEGAVIKFKRVYPRTHGETVMGDPQLKEFQGLSPYTRGNHEPMTEKRAARWSIPVHTGKPFWHRWRRDAGSIPVHTGKPVSGRGIRASGEVYPRTHGETHLHLFQ